MIRDPVETDRPALLALQSLLPEPAPEALDAALDGSGEVLVATSAPVGAVADRDRRRPIGYVFAMPGDERAYVAELVVAPDHRREGVASALFEALFDRLDERGARLVTLAVAPDNDAALEFYEQWGFREVDRDPEYYDGDPALLLARPL
ncbi:ribosomal-protein-alanine N-acetyltransferase [Natronoarchaeum philippinense]|uniref:Ribosomal-protein-alanine N-acetyltransferase n=1 Tax=Natronoarchaeum philippinense TaxID=558529 RepID=A0A285NAR7_NATPI|nr:GNAT family N-acetyltransferase [Natronoarchaeum philippinense]SNZ06562.1 ribosomal-protein-alanine N-acetyltransferase [Natronoarchaeum philippinense]